MKKGYTIEYDIDEGDCFFLVLNYDWVNRVIIQSYFLEENARINSTAYVGLWKPKATE